MTRKLTCTLPDGTVATRTTHHDYTHCVVVWVATETTHWTRNGLVTCPPHWAAISWHTSLSLALKAAASRRSSRDYFTQVQVLPVNK